MIGKFHSMEEGPPVSLAAALLMDPDTEKVIYQVILTSIFDKNIILEHQQARRIEE